MSFKSILALPLVVLSLNTMAMPSSHMDRISHKLETIKSYVKQSQQMPLSERINYFDDENLRNQLRDLQNLFKLYSYTHKGYKKLYKKTKEFEDHISHMRDRSYERNDGERERNAYEATKKKYEEFLAASKWFEEDDSDHEFKMFAKINNRVSKTSFGSVIEDRNVLLDGVMAKMEQLSTKEVDLDKTKTELRAMSMQEQHDLVEYNIHELRRDVRRIRYLNYGTTYRGGSSLVQGSSAVACPLSKDNALLETYDYKEIFPNEKYTCYISDCLTSYLSDLTSRFSSYRSYGFDAVARNDIDGLYNVIVEAKSLKSKLDASKVYLHVAHQIKMCK